jgi:hypothetical protein
MGIFSYRRYLAREHKSLFPRFFVFLLHALTIYYCLVPAPFSFNYIVESYPCHYIFINGILISYLLSEIYWITQTTNTVQASDIVLIALLGTIFFVSNYGNTYINFSNERLMYSLGFLLLARISDRHLFKEDFKLLLIGSLAICIFQLGNAIYSAISISEMDPNLNFASSIGNSGIFSCYLVVHLPILHYWLISRGRNRFQIIFIILAFTACLCAIVFTKSRTALIAWIFLFVIKIVPFYREQLKARLTFFNKWHLFAIIFIVIGVLVTIGYYIILYKFDSAVGRLMKLQITFLHLFDEFWLGVGLGRFTWIYPQWQADFFHFNEHFAHPYFFRADESFIIFSEFLQLFKELGVILFAGVCYILIRFFKASSDDKKLMQLTKTLMLTMLLFSLTSYPLHVNYFLYLVVICVSLHRFAKLKASSWLYRPVQVKSSYKIFYGLFLAILLHSCFITFKQARSTYITSSLQSDPYLSTEQITEAYEKAYPILSQDGKFLTEYGEFLASNSFKIDRAIQLLEEARLHYISSRTMLALSIAYIKKRDYVHAANNLNWIVSYLPNRFWPRYYLMTMYVKANNHKLAKEVADIILTMPVKIPSTEVERIKKEALLVSHSTL